LLQSYHQFAAENGVDKPPFDYERTIFDSLATQNGNADPNKHLWIKKATGLVIPEHKF
jgi:hypothetical protein